MRFLLTFEVLLSLNCHFVVNIWVLILPGWKLAEKIPEPAFRRLPRFMYYNIQKVKVDYFLHLSSMLREFPS